MRRLYLKLYLAFAGIVFCCAVVMGITWHAWGEPDEFQQAFARGLAGLMLDGLSEPGDPGFEQELRARASKLSIDVALYDAERELLATSLPQALPFPDGLHQGFFKTREAMGIAFRMDDGRWFAAIFPRSKFHRRFFLTLAFFGIAMAVGCYPLARQITRRLEHLKSAMDRFGQGALDARAKVCGKDEVASLAQSFNATATRIEGLIGQQKRMLASASHELRSPLARVRMAVELMQSAEPERQQQLADEVHRDIEELNELVEDLLLAVKAEQAPSSDDEVDLEALVREEAARFSATAALEPVTLHGSRRMLKRLLRNLLENARHHGSYDGLSIQLTARGDTVRIAVEDRGPGVLESERERIFEPFYRPNDHDETKHGGVGLGLALVKQIAEHHGGKAWCEARDGGGSRFVVELKRHGSA